MTAQDQAARAGTEALDVDAVRADFPILARTVRDRIGKSFLIASTSKGTVSSRGDDPPGPPALSSRGATPLSSSLMPMRPLP